MSDNNDIVKELKKMNEFLEKIDWKLWNLHKKVFEDRELPPDVSTTKPVNKDIEPVVPTAKYPTIETWE